MQHLLLVLAALLATGPALAQTAPHDSHTGASVATPANAYSDGEVRKVDKAAKKITLKHGEIRNLDMTPMTMVFQVKDAALLEKVKAGDQVRFTADKVGGAYIVLSIEPVKP
jgi:Cu(I)/Ag(I) efflux system protein CusF